MKKIILPLILGAVLYSCNSSEEVNDNKDINFFPIAGNINAELRELDTLPIAIMKYTTQGTVIDTAIATKEEFRKAAEEMITPDISSPDLKKYFTETVFYDKTSNSLTMSYTTKSEKPVVRKIDVIINQETEKLRSIYVEKLEKKGDTTLNSRMVWTPGKNYQVISIGNVPGQQESVKTIKYSWGMQ